MVKDRQNPFDKRYKSMTYLELKHLKDYCEKHEIDADLIDDQISYEENLTELAPYETPIHDLFDIDYRKYDFDNSPEAKKMAKAIEEEWEAYKHQPLYVKYGIDESQLDSLKIPFMVFNFYYKIPFHLYYLLKLKLRDYEASQIVTWYSKWHFKVSGTAKELLEVAYLLPAGVQIFGKDKPYQRGVILTPKGWIRIPETEIEERKKLPKGSQIPIIPLRVRA